MTHRRLAAAWSVIALLVTGTAAAQTRDQQWDRCHFLDVQGNLRPGMSADAAIGACTALIQSRQLAIQSLSESLANRGHAYNVKGEYDRAIADYDQALRLNPNYVNAYIARGVAHAGKGEYDRAIADYDQALRLNPNNAFAYNNRSNAYRLKGDKNRADSKLSGATPPGDTSQYTNTSQQVDLCELFDPASKYFHSAYAADEAKNYSEAARWFLAIEREDRSYGDLAMAEFHLGIYSVRGTGMSQDYNAAAQWFQRSINRDCLPSIWAKFWLGMLYAWGEGVPQDRQKARALFAEADRADGVRQSQSKVVELLDNNALPRNPDDVEAAIKDFAARKTQKAAEEAAQQEREREKQEAARRQREAAAWAALPEAEKKRRLAEQKEEEKRRSAEQASRNSDNCSLGDWMIAPKFGWVGGAYLGGGCH